MKDNGTRRLRHGANSLYKLYSQKFLQVVGSVVQQSNLCCGAPGEAGSHLTVTCPGSLQIYQTKIFILQSKMVYESCSNKDFVLFITSERHSFLNMFLTCH